MRIVKPVNSGMAANARGIGFNVPKYVYVTLGGGLGDVFYVYSRGENGWGYIKALKEIYPHVTVRAMCSTHNPQTVEFIKHNPYIDEIEEYGWLNDAKPLWEKHNNGARRLSKESKLLKTLSFSRPKVYLSEEDNKIVEEVTSNGEFILIHPFAGERQRIAVSTDQWADIIDEIIDKKKINVAVIGGSYSRVNFKTQEEKPEEFSYQRDGLFNLVDRCNARVCFELAKRQKQFVGSWSAYSCASWVNGKKTTVAIPKIIRDRLKNKMQKGKRWHNVKCKVIVTEAPAHKNTADEFNKIRRQILDSIDAGKE